MILKKTKSIEYLKIYLSEQNPIEIDKNIFFFTLSNIGFFNTLISKKSLQKTPSNLVWITSNRFLFRKYLSSLQPLYLLRRENETYKIYDRRYLKLKKGMYFLPPVEVRLIFSTKNAVLFQKEEPLFFPVRAISFFCEGDTTSRLKDPSYLERLQKKQKETKSSFKVLSKLFLYLKEKLDS